MHWRLIGDPPTDTNCYTGAMPRPHRATGHAVPLRPEVMTISDLSKYLQVSKSSLYKLVQSDRVPGQKVGKHWRFHKGVIDRWLASRGDSPYATTRASPARAGGPKGGAA